MRERRSKVNICPMLPQPRGERSYTHRCCKLGAPIITSMHNTVNTRASVLIDLNCGWRLPDLLMPLSTRRTTPLRDCEYNDMAVDSRSACNSWPPAESINRHRYNALAANRNNQPNNHTETCHAMVHCRAASKSEAVTKNNLPG